MTENETIVERRVARKSRDLKAGARHAKGSVRPSSFGEIDGSDGSGVEGKA